MSATMLFVALALVSQVALGDRYSNGAGSTDGDAHPPREFMEESAAEAFESTENAAQAGAGVTPPPVSNTQSPSGADHDGASQAAVPSTPSQSAARSSQPLNSYPSRSAPPSDRAQGTNSRSERPSAIMRALLTPPPGARLSGQPVSLAQVLSAAGARDQQSKCIEAYWDSCSSAADYYVSLREQEEMRRLRGQLGNAVTSPTWQQAEAELGARVKTSQAAALASQYRLRSLTNTFGDLGHLPLPADVPHCGDYQSRYEENFATRPNAEAEQLAAFIPLRYQEIKGAAAAVSRTEEWLAAESSTADEATLLSALELVSLRRRKFAQLVHDYNRRIARYSELVAPGEIETDRLISMLIVTDPQATATRSSSESPSRRRPSNNDRATAPRTYADGWMPARSERSQDDDREKAVQPASAELQSFREERSLLVKPR